MEAIKLIALDMDGTLLDSDGRLSEENRAALEAAMGKGVHVVIATGRAASALPRDVLAVPGIECAITSNGARVVTLPDQRVLYENLLRPETVQEVLELSQGYDVMLEAFWKGDAYAQGSCLKQVEHYGIMPEYLSYIRETRRPVGDIAAFMQEHRAELENINVVFASQEERLALWERMKRLKNTTITTSFPFNVEAGAQTASKADALAFLCQSWGILQSEVMAFGDSLNDGAMLAWAGFPVAMGNACPELKQMAKFITETNNENGVAAAIQQFIL